MITGEGEGGRSCFKSRGAGDRFWLPGWKRPEGGKPNDQTVIFKPYEKGRNIVQLQQNYQVDSVHWLPKYNTLIKDVHINRRNTKIPLKTKTKIQTN